MDFRILGPFEVVEDGRALDLGAQKQRALLTVLLLDANRVVPADRLIEALWPDGPTETAPKALQLYVSRLRKTLGRDRLETRSPGYLLRVEDGEVDVERARKLAGDGQVREALALWRGPPLSDFAYAPFAQAEIARLEDFRLGCLEDRIDRDLAEGHHADVIGELEGLVADHPLRERPRAQLMLALYRSGRQAEALEAYQRARSALVDELGIDPSRELRELQQAILNQDPALDLVAAGEPGRESARGAFVGRAAERAQLTVGLEDAMAGRGRLFLLVGEPGIGKSRLVDELIGEARVKGALVLVGRCWEVGGAPAYWPWVQALKAYAQFAEPAALRAGLGMGGSDLAQLLPELREAFPDLAPLPAVEPEGARFRLFEAVSAFCRNISASRPLVIALDDLHAADEPSLLLLRYLAREIGSTHVLLIGALRDVAPTPSESVTALLADSTREPAARRISLSGLGEGDIAEYLRLAAAEIASDELTSALYDETEGNPLFVTETVQLLALEGLRPDPSGAPIAIPQSVRDVIGRRLALLPDECNRVLVLAAVLGREFDVRTLARMAGKPEHELLDSLDEAMLGRIVSEVPGEPDRLRFAHVLIRDALYDDLTAARRASLHRSAVEALEVLGADAGQHLAELAHHAVAGRELDKGVDYAERAGDRAAMSLAYEEAARLYAVALEAARSADDETRARLLLRMGDVQTRAGDVSACKATYLRVAEIARTGAMPEQLARAALGYGGPFVWSRAWGDRQLVPLLQEALAALPEGDSELRVRLLSRLAAGPLRDTASAPMREAMSQEAVDMARRLGEPAALAYAVAGRHCANFGPDVVALRLELGTELIELSKVVGDRERAYEGHDFRFHSLLELGDLPAASREIEALNDLARDLGRGQLWFAAVNRAKLALFTGRFADAESAIREAVELGPAETANPQMAFRVQSYALRRERGSLGEVVDDILSSVENFPDYPVLKYVALDVLVQLGRLDEARDAFESLAADGFAFQLEMQWLFSLSLAAEACVQLADAEQAERLYELLLPYALLNATLPPELCRGSVSRELASLAATTARWDEAVHFFEQAVEMNTGMGARPWLAHTEADYAHMLFARGGAGDREKGTALMESALRTYRELGMAGPLAKLESR